MLLLGPGFQLVADNITRFLGVLMFLDQLILVWEFTGLVLRRGQAKQTTDGLYRMGCFTLGKDVIDGGE